MRMVLMRAYPGSPSWKEWADFFLHLPGSPAFVVSDEDDTIRKAMGLVWPHVPYRRAWDKLEINLEEVLRKSGRRGSHEPMWVAKGHYKSGDPSNLSIFEDLRAFAKFATMASAPPHRDPVYLEAWINRMVPIVTRS